MDMTVVALKPEEMRPAQESLVVWVGEKLRSLDAEMREQEAMLAEAQTTTFTRQAAGWRAALGRTRRRIVFYDKIRAALEAGYIVVPNFPVDVFAVRTAAKSPGFHPAQWPSHVPDVKAEKLPAGAGRYVSPRPVLARREYQTQDPTTKALVKKSEFYEKAFIEEIEFPVALTQPMVLKATDDALKRLIFDDVGMVGQPRRDPIIVGRLLDPIAKYGPVVRVTFFIAWWLDTRVL